MAHKCDSVKLRASLIRVMDIEMAPYVLCCLQSSTGRRKVTSHCGAQVEAVENHMPEVVIVDEIGTEAEALACRSIAERGVQLIGTAHGQILENLMKNPTLSDLIGGIQSVTLGAQPALDSRSWLGPGTSHVMLSEEDDERLMAVSWPSCRAFCVHQVSQRPSWAVQAAPSCACHQSLASPRCERRR